jgi:hypothetical protein
MMRGGWATVLRKMGIRRRSMKPDPTNRELQFYAVLCLCRYCDSRNVSAKPLDDLVTHLVSFLTVPRITDWEIQGTQLEMTGRGDEVPAEVLQQIPAGERDLFLRLLEECVSVGITDMYGANTDSPRKCLMHCVRLIGECGLDTDDIQRQLIGSPTIVEWGAVMPEEDRIAMISGYPELQRYLRPAA